MIKKLIVRKITIDTDPKEQNPFVELRIDLHLLNDDYTPNQIVSDYGRIYKRIGDFHPVPIGNIADDGVVDNFELAYLVSMAALQWVAIEYNTTITPDGKVYI